MCTTSPPWPALPPGVLMAWSQHKLNSLQSLFWPDRHVRKTALLWLGVWQNVTLKQQSEEEEKEEDLGWTGSLDLCRTRTILNRQQETSCRFRRLKMHAGVLLCFLHSVGLCVIEKSQTWSRSSRNQTRTQHNSNQTALFYLQTWAASTWWTDSRLGWAAPWDGLLLCRNL